MDERLIEMVKESHPEIDESFIKKNLSAPTSAEQLQALAHKVSLPPLTIIVEKKLLHMDDIGNKKFIILTHQYGTKDFDGHWITIFPDSSVDNTFFFFDPYGQKFKNKYFDIYYYFPEEYRIVDFNPNMDFQSDETSICGWYCIAVLYCWYVLSNKKLWHVIKLKPIDKTDLFDKDKEVKRKHNDILVAHFIHIISNNDKNEVINHYKI